MAVMSIADAGRAGNRGRLREYNLGLRTDGELIADFAGEQSRDVVIVPVGSPRLALRAVG